MLKFENLTEIFQQPHFFNFDQNEIFTLSFGLNWVFNPTLVTLQIISITTLNACMMIDLDVDLFVRIRQVFVILFLCHFLLIFERFYIYVELFLILLQLLLAVFR